MLDKIEVSQQQLRSMALNAMVLALDAQAAALQSMDREHSLGIESSYSVKSLLGKAKDFVQSAAELVKLSESVSFIETRQKVRSLAAGAQRLKEEAAEFITNTNPKANSRYEQLLMELGEAKSPEATAPAGNAETPNEVGAQGRKITAQAGFACLRAEIDEFAAFSLQIHATCNLALEYALNAAAKSAQKNAC